MLLLLAAPLQREHEPAPGSIAEWQQGNASRCAGVTKNGHRCRLEARRDGFCGLYHINAQVGARRMRLLVLAAMAANTALGLMTR